MDLKARIFLGPGRILTSTLVQPLTLPGFQWFLWPQRWGSWDSDMKNHNVSWINQLFLWSIWWCFSWINFFDHFHFSHLILPEFNHWQMVVSMTSWGIPNSWMAYFVENPKLKGMVWGSPPILRTSMWVADPIMCLMILKLYYNGLIMIYD